MIHVDNINVNKINNEQKITLYNKVKHLSVYVKYGLSKKSKNELIEFIKNVDNYSKNKLAETTNYKQISFGNKTINLDEEQHKIVVNNPLLNAEKSYHMRILAGAGSGKTTTILCRIKYLIDKFVLPNEILVLTFNVDAANNLKERIIELFGFDINVEIRTIDSLCYKLKMNYSENNYKIKQSISELGVEGENIMLKYGKLISEKYRFVFFDEFQDINDHQFNILKVFAENNCNLTVIGDDNQNIYQWRGSNNFYIINMDKILDQTNHNVQTFTIRTNYRSTPRIVHFANDSINLNNSVIEKTMMSMKKLQDDDNKIPIKICGTVKKQFEYIIETIQKNGKYDNFAILSRNGTYLKYAEEYLQKHNVPCVAIISNKKSSCGDESKPTIQPNKVTITTIHRSKGLEWDHVFIVGMTDTYFPSHVNNNIKNIDEERRLFYVGVTRAKTFLEFVVNNSEFPLSRFLGELIKTKSKHLEILNSIKNKSTNKKEEIFNFDNLNTPKLNYAVMDIVNLLQGSQITHMRELGLIPNAFAPKTTSLFEKQICFNSAIKENYLEPDYGEFCDRVLTREIILNTINNSTKIKDYDTESIINSVILSEDEMEIYNKYNLKNLFQDFSYNASSITQYIHQSIPIYSDRATAINICKKMQSEKEFIKVGTYPSYFINNLKSSYKTYMDETIKTKDILKELYDISLSRNIMNERRRLMFRDVSNMFINDFDEIYGRINEYVNNYIVKSKLTVMCKMNSSYIFKINDEYIKLSGELDMYDVTNKMVVDFKCSQTNEFKVEWVVQVLLYCALLINDNKLNINQIDAVGVFNVMSGKLYTIKIDENYDFESLLKYAEFLIQSDMNGNRPNTNTLNIDFLKSFGCNVPLEDDYDKSKPQVIVDINTDFNNFVIYDSDDSDDEDEINKKALSNKYISFDVETGTTGVTSSVIQIGYIIYDNEFNEIKKVNKFIKNRNVEKRLFMIHGISIDHLNEYGCEFADVIKEFLFDLYDCNVIIGHNVSSDIRHIKSNIEKYCDCYYLEHGELAHIYNPFDGKQIYDTMITGKIVMNSKKNAKLEELYSYLFPGSIMENAHDALYDCKITADCCFRMMEIIKYNEKKKPKIKPITEYLCEK